MKTSSIPSERPARLTANAREYLGALVALSAWTYRVPYDWERELVNRWLRPSEERARSPRPAPAAEQLCGCTTGMSACGCAAG